MIVFVKIFVFADGILENQKNKYRVDNYVHMPRMRDLFNFATLLKVSIIRKCNISIIARIICNSFWLIGK